MAALPRFASIDELVEEHSAMLKRYVSGQFAEAIPKAKEFVARAVGTGSILRQTSDREAAQSRINYWSTTLLQDFEISFDDLLLAELDEKQLAAARAQWVAAARTMHEGLGEPDRKLFQTLIGRIAGYTESGKIVGKTAARTDLRKLGDVDPIIAQLKNAGIVRITVRRNPDEEIVEAADVETIRAWPEALKWLKDDLARNEKRQSVKVAAEQWIVHKRDPGGLLAGSLLAQAQSYTDLNDVEAEFVRASQASELSRLESESSRLKSESSRLKSDKVKMGVIILLLIFACGALFYAWKIADRQEKQAEQLLNYKRQMTAKASPAVSGTIQCTGSATRSTVGESYWWYTTSVAGAVLTGASTVTYRVEFPIAKEPLVILTTYEEKETPPSVAVWTGIPVPSKIIALLEYLDPARPPVIGTCGQINWTGN